MPSLFRDVKIRTTSVRDNQYVVYKVELFMKSNQWAIWRRYSDFVDLHSKIADLYSLPELPPKKMFGNLSPRLTAERRQALEDYLKRLLLEHNEDIAVNPHISRFLELKGKVPMDTLENRLGRWHESYDEMMNLVSTISGNLAVRGRLKQQGKDDDDLVLDIRRKMMLLTEGTRDLQATLDEVEKKGSGLITDGELLLRQNKLQTLMGKREELERAEKTAPTQMGNAEQRSELMGTGSSQRVWGRETAETAGKSNLEVVNVQRQLMDQQDEGLDRLQAIIQRQKQIALSINEELDTQNNMLDDLNVQVERTQGHMATTTKRVMKLL
eukprot:comp19903_c0_seq1/m.24127 comp19903_c0_seq1/g.24127  ORF comp19903_c0_seq1/g.24127 comp19903_c0_seq1/m.24127 type:complete len:326 (-) comp19903_c0_seq1:596-1573(-)